jgi:hypothetical protein
MNGKNPYKTGLVDLPLFRGMNVAEVLVNLYRDLGWNGIDHVQPTKILMNEGDWLSMLKYVTDKVADTDEVVEVGFFFVDKSPSGSKEVQPGKIMLLDGWQCVTGA